MNNNVLSSIQNEIVRERSDLEWRLGLLENQHETETESFNESFEVYDAFYNIHLMDNASIREASNTRGKIDALRFLLHSEEPQEHINALDTARTPTALIERIDKRISDIAQGKHGYTSRTAQLDYRRGWRHALRYAFDTEKRDWSSQVYNQPLNQTIQS